MDVIVAENANNQQEVVWGDGLKKASSSASLTNGGSSNALNDTDWRKLMNLLLQLRKICNHTYLMPEVAPNPV